MIDEPLFPRRQPCPCGSGKKFKNCCESIAPTIDARKILSVEAAHPGMLSGMIAGFDEELQRRKLPLDTIT